VTFEPTEVDGAWLVGLDPHQDDRGFFARLWDASEFEARGLASSLDQCSLSYNRRAGTVRGMHYQAAPREEIKVVRCVRGSIYDVLLDLRPASTTYRQWVGRELTSDNRLCCYVPRGVAHGFQTLTDDAEVLYLIAGPYDPDLARGVRWNDPAFNIRWPLTAAGISDRDRLFPDFRA